jgi:non-ribosomal peptide synthetase component F
MPLAAALPCWLRAGAVGSADHRWRVVIPTADHLMPDVMRHMIATNAVNTAWLTSSLFNLFVDEAIESFSGLSLLMTGGERLSPSHVRRTLERHPDIVLLNGYGPVESCVFATTHRIRQENCDNPPASRSARRCHTRTSTS